MDDTEFDRALIIAAFELAAQKGWHRMSVVEAARGAGLPLDRARARFPDRAALLMRFGRLADQAALAGAAAEGPSRDRLFDLVMSRIDVLQTHRAGMLALLRAIPVDPLLALMLGGTSLRSMGWLLEAAGIEATGPAGLLRAEGLLAVWLYVVRAWQRDESPDLSGTMRALDDALNRAERVAGWLRRSKADPGFPPDALPDNPAPAHPAAPASAASGPLNPSAAPPVPGAALPPPPPAADPPVVPLRPDPPRPFPPS